MSIKSGIKTALIKFHLLDFARFFKKSFSPFIICFKSFIIFIKYNSKSVDFFKSEKKITTLVITHGSGGGTAKFINNFFNNYDSVYVLSSLSRLSSFYYLLEEVESGKFWYFTEKQLFYIFEKVDKSIYINSFIYYKNIKYVQKTIFDIKKQNNNLNIEYFVHDFHSVCQSMHLMNESEYCNLECKKNKCKIACSVFEWREMWKNFFPCVDTIRCFSENSKLYIVKFFPEFEDKVIVVPHDMSYCSNTALENINLLQFNAAIIGNISNDAKGLAVCDYLLRGIRNTNIRLTFIGMNKIDYFGSERNSDNAIFLGRYKNDDLENILLREKISHVFFTSVCPETFSYLISELMLMKIPIIGFDVGAQGEKLKGYEHGNLVNNKEEMLDYLVKKALK